MSISILTNLAQTGSRLEWRRSPVLSQLEVSFLLNFYCYSLHKTLMSSSPNKLLTRMHSSRMCTTHSSSCLLGVVCLSACWNTPPPRCGPGDPLGCGPRDPLGRPLNFTPGCGPGDPPPPARPLNFPPGCGPGNLQCMLG